MNMAWHTLVALQSGDDRARDAEERVRRAEGQLAEERARVAEVRSPKLSHDRCGLTLQRV